MRLHEFDKGAVRIFDIGEEACCLAHVKAVPLMTRLAVDCKREARLAAVFAQVIHPADVIAEVNEPGVTPESPLEYPRRFAVKRLYKLNDTLAEDGIESAMEWS